MITITNQKAGVGKSVIATNLAVGLARDGRIALALDLDSQTHGTGRRSRQGGAVAQGGKDDRAGGGESEKAGLPRTSAGFP